METQRVFLFAALALISMMLYQNWLEFKHGKTQQTLQATEQVAPKGSELLPETPEAVKETIITTDAVSAPFTQLKDVTPEGQLITVTTDLFIATINSLGGNIERLELLKEAVSVDKKDQGFPLLKQQHHDSNQEIFITQDGLLVKNRKAPNHIETLYSVNQTEYTTSNTNNEITVPLNWVSADGVSYKKVYTFKKDSYVVAIDYQIENRSQQDWSGYLYAQFNRSEPFNNKKGSFAQLPSYMGGVIYTEEEKYEKIKFDDMEDKDLSTETNSGWVAMLQHYFVAAWIPENGGKKLFYSSVNKNNGNPKYKIGYKTLEATTIVQNQSGHIGTALFVGPKEQERLKKIEKEQNIEGLHLTVDYGMLTFIADPLFWVLAKINVLVKNWGWSIILLTILIKLIFYPLSAASYRSMAGMKKLQPRIQTLKERYKDDKQKFQLEMMGLYKKEKINPAGGCLPILIQIPVFIALYWVLLESVELRQASFALWLQDLSSPDPYFVLPVLMGASMWLQQKLNPAPMEDIQKKVMMIMPIALTFLFLSFPQGLVLYWVVNNILSILQQWRINSTQNV